MSYLCGMPHKVFIRHTYIYKCSSCEGEWKVNEAMDLERPYCPHCGVGDFVDFVLEDQRRRSHNRFE